MGVYYAHPDGLLRSAGNGAVGGPWGTPVTTKIDAAGRASLAAASTAAGKLTYVPSADTTGLLPGTPPTALVPFGTGTTEVAGAWGTTPLEGRIVWGQLNPSSVGQSSLYNSWVAGPRPDLVNASPNSTGLIRETNNNVRVWKAQHTVFNSLAWCMPELDPPGGAWDLDEALFLLRNSIGIRGGRFQIDFCEMTGIQDPANIAATLTSLTTDELITNGAYRRHSWVHGALFYQGAGHSQPEGTHSDLSQWSRPQYFTDEYNLFGGPNDDVSGYALDPARETSDGAKNAGMMVQQESDGGSDLGRIKHVTVRRNILWQHPGNGYNINHHYKTTYPNAMETVAFEDNLHVQRDDSKYVLANLTHYADRHSGHRIIAMNAQGTGWTDVGPVTLASGA